MRVLLDTNIVLDLLLEREPWRIEADAIAKAGVAGRIHVYVSESSITDIFYISCDRGGGCRTRRRDSGTRTRSPATGAGRSRRCSVGTETEEFP
jgi:hypothetical protein